MLRTKIIHLILGFSLLSLGFTPLPGPSAVTYNINGHVTYVGSHTENVPIKVSVFLDWHSPPIDTVEIPTSGGDYQISDLDPDTYYVSATKDLDGSNTKPDPNEPNSWYDANKDGTPDPVIISDSNVTGIDITLEDPIPRITGEVTYVGSDPGQHEIFIAAHPDSGGSPSPSPVDSTHILQPGGKYGLYELANGSYYISAFLDLNDSGGGPPDPGEPETWYDANGDGTPDLVEYNGTLVEGIDIILGNVLYVDVDAQGNNTGTSWANAFTSLQPALSSAIAGDAIWVAEGVYYPGTDRSSTFQLIDKVSLYGGFAGNETIRSERDWQANPTVLSGDIGTPGTKTDNAYHVVTASNTDSSAILDGFTITGGNANIDDGFEDKGGGLLNQSGSPTLVNLNFLDNYAINHGSAIVNQYPGAQPLIANCTFSGNTTFHNGSIANLGSAKPTIVNSTLTGNSGGSSGGIVNLSGQAIVSNTILWGNSGAEISLQSGGTITITYSLIEGGYTGTGNISTNPNFIDADGADNTYGTMDDDLRIHLGSPATDAGSNANLPQDLSDSDGDGDYDEALSTDMAGAERQADDPDVTDTGFGTLPIVDMGAYEQNQPITGLSALNDSPTASNATTTLSASITTGTGVIYNWGFGDGNTGNGKVVEHDYTVAGHYLATVTALNSRNTMTATTNVTIFDIIDIAPGDTFTSTDDIIVITSPAEITETLVISYTPMITIPFGTGDLPFAGTAFTLGAELSDGTPVTTPDQPLTIIVHYAQNGTQAVTSQSTPKLYRYDESAQSWVALTTITVDSVKSTITAALDHFSVFAVLYPRSYDLFIPLILR